MIFWLIISIALTVGYAFLMIFYWQGWRAMPIFQLPNNIPKHGISVVVAARNEAANIVACLESIARNDYPAAMFEIILVDDHSDDDTLKIVKQWAENQSISIKIIELSAHLPASESPIFSFKKIAIECGIRQARHGIIATTDADCEVPPRWLAFISAAFDDPNVQLVAAPVAFFREKNLLERFQSLDCCGTMGITGAGIQRGVQRMGNGANLAYRKSVFEAVQGFANNQHRASGDDIFLMQKVAAQHPQGIRFLKNQAATVHTLAQPTLRDFVQQRIRWGSKNDAYSEKWVTVVAVVVFFFCWSIVINLAAALASSAMLTAVLLFQILIKMLFDALLLVEMCRFFRRTDLMRIFVPAFWMHVFYIAGVGLASIFMKKYVWKGRKVF